VAELAAPALSAPGATVLDAGTGTGHYLRTLLDRTPAAAIGLDISKFALRRAARLNPEAVNLVTDVWQPLPVADDAVDVVTVVFAPRNAAEFARVLRPAGRLVVVTPRPGHLAEVSARTGMLGIEPAKEERLAASLGADFSQHSARELDLTLSLTPDDVANLALMGPARELDLTLSLTPDDVANLALMGPAGHHLERAALASLVAGLPPLTAASARFRISVFEPVVAPVVAPGKGPAA